jgi:hypothetical protein
LIQRIIRAFEVLFLNELSLASVKRPCHLFVILVAILVPVLGCPGTNTDPRSLPRVIQETKNDIDDGNAGLRSETAAEDDANSLADRIEKVLQANLTGRQLSTEVHGAWQIMHGVLAYGPDFEVQSSEGQVRVIEHVLKGGSLKGFILRSGDRFDAPKDAPKDSADALYTRGIRADLDPGTKLGQGHRDQWLAYLVSCSLPLNQVIQTLDGPRRLDLWLRQMEWDVPLNFEREYSWTLMSLIPYRGTQHRWTARDGQDYSVETLLRSEIDLLSPTSACGGAHRLTAISIALNQRKAEGGTLTGVWADAQALVDVAIEQAFEFQNEDGSFSSNYFEREGWSLDVATAIGTTGHTLEFIAKGGSDEVIASDATMKAAKCLCRMLEQTAEHDLECGALYHALSGLQIYRRRLEKISS